MPIRRDEWLSRALGKPAYRVDFEGKDREHELAELERAAQPAFYYAKLDTIDVAGSRALGAAGFYVADVNVTLEASPSAVLSRHGLNIETLNTRTVDAPMGGGRLFEADVVARIPTGADLAVLREDLERLAAEILVDLTLTQD